MGSDTTEPIRAPVLLLAPVGIATRVWDCPGQRGLHGVAARPLIYNTTSAFQIKITQKYVQCTLKQQQELGGTEITVRDRN